MTSGKSSRVLVLANHDNQRLDPISARLVSAAKGFDLPVDMIVAGMDCRSVADEAAALIGIEQVLLADHEELANSLPENLGAQLAPLLQDRYDVLLASANTLGRELVPRLAATLDVSPLTDVTQIIEPDLFERPIHAGAALVQMRVHEAKKLMTVRAGRFAPAPNCQDGEARAKLVMLDKTLAARRSQLIGQEFFWDQPSLECAAKVIGVGRGASSKEIFAMIDDLAVQLDAVVGGTRVAVETGMVPNNVQIGQTGVQIAPDLYIALGISGAVQHIAGIKDAGTIVAINKDADAPLFKVADYGMVGDLHELLPKLQKALADKS